MSGAATHANRLEEAAAINLNIVTKTARTQKISTSTPLNSARLLRESFRASGVHGLHFVNGEFFHWNGSHFESVPDDAMRATGYKWMSRCVDAQAGTPIAPNRRSVTDLLDALKGEAFANVASPQWLDDGEHPDPRDIIVVANGMLDTRTRTMMAPDPRLYVTSALPIRFDPNAPEPVHWLSFLNSVWSDDPESIAALCEWMGLCALTGDTSLQKALLIVGPRRSGKGTAFRVLRALAGDANVCAPTFASLASHFGLASFINKRVALVSDARMSGRTDAAMVAENILRITGEDAITVARKHVSDWIGKLPTRFVIATNELPSLADASAALSSRFVILRMTRSFYGSEDHGLTERLLAELPSILLWAMDGLDKLRARGRLLQPQSGAELVDELEALASPISMFVRDDCTCEPAAETAITDLFEAWRKWCDSNGRDHPGTTADFGKRLRANVPSLVATQPRRNGERVRCYRGIALQGDSRDGGTGGTRWNAFQSNAHDARQELTSNRTERVPSRANDYRAAKDGEP